MKRLEEHVVWGKPVRRRMLRFLGLIAIGYALHLPFFSLRKTIRTAGPSEIKALLQSDVLQCIGVTLVLLHRVGSGELAAPPTSVDGFRSWLASVNSTIVVLVVVRLAAIALGWYALAVTTLGCAARVMALPRATGLVERMTPTCARGLLGGVALLGVMAAPPAPHGPRDTMVELTDDPTDDRVTLHLVTDEHATTTSAPPAATPTTSMLQPSMPEAPTALSHDDNLWTVDVGDCFWSIARSHLADVKGSAISDREIGPYWHQLVELNRGRLMNPEDPNLLFSGQVIELPAVG